VEPAVALCVRATRGADVSWRRVLVLRRPRARRTPARAGPLVVGRGRVAPATRRVAAAAELPAVRHGAPFLQAVVGAAHLEGEGITG
jgi:hypothetical protein